MYRNFKHPKGSNNWYKYLKQEIEASKVPIIATYNLADAEIRRIRRDYNCKCPNTIIVQVGKPTPKWEPKMKDFR